MVNKKKPIKKQRPLTIKQRKFVDEVVKTGSWTKAAKKVYKCKNEQTAHSIWCENLSKPIIKDTIDDRLQKAKNKIYTLMETAEKEETQLRAAQDIIDRWEGKPTQRIISENTIKVVDKDTPMEDLLAMIKK